MNLRWLISRTFRQATDLRKQVWIVLNSQRDRLTPKARQAVADALEQFNRRLRGPGDAGSIQAAMKGLEETATKWLQPYPHAGVRENIKEFLVSGVLILTIFTFFIQPMKIPSGSAQPTLYGNVVTDLRNSPDSTIPSLPLRIRDWFRGIDYHRWVAKEDGSLQIEPVRKTLGFIKIQRFRIGRDSYSFWWPPDYLERKIGVNPGTPFRAGDTVFELKITSGDRLFVDRVSYNFRRPRRGETIVFTSTGVPKLIQDTHYIKRLIAKGGERVRIGNDRHVFINGERLDARTPGFQNVYSFNGPPRDSVYSGHVNGVVAAQYGKPGLAPHFPDETHGMTVPKNHYLAFGDNTMNSFDGRAWGAFPREKVVGRALFVFWPITSRFGLVYP